MARRPAKSDRDKPKKPKRPGKPRKPRKTTKSPGAKKRAGLRAVARGAARTRPAVLAAPLPAPDLAPLYPVAPLADAAARLADPTAFPADLRAAARRRRHGEAGRSALPARSLRVALYVGIGALVAGVVFYVLQRNDPGALPKEPPRIVTPPD